MQRNKLYMTILGAVLLFGACAEKEGERPALSDKPLTFTASMATDWNGAQPTRGTVLQTASRELESDFNRPLYLHTVTTAGFKDDGEATMMTRGTQVSAITEFSVSGYCYNKDGNQTVSDVQPNFLNDHQVTKMAMSGRAHSSSTGRCRAMPSTSMPTHRPTLPQHRRVTARCC